RSGWSRSGGRSSRQPRSSTTLVLRSSIVARNYVTGKAQGNPDPAAEVEGSAIPPQRQGPYLRQPRLGNLRRETSPPAPADDLGRAGGRARTHREPTGRHAAGLRDG